MATDIRRMSREDLDRLNAEGKAWRERNKPAQDQTPEQPATDAIQTPQLDEVVHAIVAADKRLTRPN